MAEKGKISSLADGKAIVIPSWSTDAVTPPLNVPRRIYSKLKVDTPVAYELFDDNTGIVIEIMDPYEDDLNAHTQDYNNPHRVTKEQIGLGKVENMSREDLEELAFEIAYPVEKVILTFDARNPRTYLKRGNWEREAEGCALFGTDPYTTDMSQAGDIFGQNSKILTTDNMPSHIHTINHTHGGTAANAGAHVHNLKGYGATLGAGSTGWRFGSSGTKTGTGIVLTAGAHTHTVSTTSISTSSSGAAGRGIAFDNRPQGMSLFVWRRIS